MISQNKDQVVRMRFPLVGKGDIPIDHGATLYGSISKALPELHGLEQIGISPIEGGIFNTGLLSFDNNGYFFIQMPVSLVRVVQKLAGKSLKLKDNLFRVGIPRMNLIIPSSEIYARKVTVKGKMDETSLKKYIERTIQEGTGLNPDDPLDIKILRRRIISIHSRKVVSYGVRISHLQPDISQWVQTEGPWSRRRFGCAFFYPVRGEEL